MASKTELLGLKPPTETIEVGGLSVRVRGMTRGARARYQKHFIKLGADGKVAVREDIDLAAIEELLLLECIVDDFDVPLFTAEDLAELNSLDPEVVDALTAAAKRLSGLGEDDAQNP